MLFPIIVFLLSATVAISAWAAFETEGLFVAGAVIGIAWSIIHEKAHKSISPIEIFILIIIIGMLIGLLFPPFISGRTPEECRDMCVSRLKQLALALHAYHEDFGSFPPAYIADADGKPSHSWRSLVLPYIDGGPGKGDVYTELEEKYSFDGLWNSPGNSKLSFDGRIHRHFCGSAYCCPDDPSRWDSPVEADAASYFAVVGPQAAWRGADPVSLDDLPERGKRMILLIEARGRNINWKEPKDLAYEDAAAGVNRFDGRGLSSEHTLGDDYRHHPLHGAYVAFVDGSVHFLPDDIPAEDLEAMLTGDTSRRIDLDSLARPQLNLPHIIGPPVLVLSALALLLVVILRRVGHKG